MTAGSLVFACYKSSMRTEWSSLSPESWTFLVLSFLLATRLLLGCLYKMKFSVVVALLLIGTCSSFLANNYRKGVSVLYNLQYHAEWNIHGIQLSNLAEIGWIWVLNISKFWCLNFDYVSYHWKNSKLARSEIVKYKNYLACVILKLETSKFYKNLLFRIV